MLNVECVEEEDYHLKIEMPKKFEALEANEHWRRWKEEDEKSSQSSPAIPLNLFCFPFLLVISFRVV